MTKPETARAALASRKSIFAALVRETLEVREVLASPVLTKDGMFSMVAHAGWRADDANTFEELFDALRNMIPDYVMENGFPVNTESSDMFMLANVDKETANPKVYRVLVRYERFLSDTGLRKLLERHMHGNFFSLLAGAVQDFVKWSNQYMEAEENKEEAWREISTWLYDLLLYPWGIVALSEYLVRNPGSIYSESTVNDARVYLASAEEEAAEKLSAWPF